MPQKIKMFLSNGNNFSQLNSVKNINSASLTQLNPINNKAQVNGGLHTSIIGRIHNVRPGCGSCGRH